MRRKPATRGPFATSDRASRAILPETLLAAALIPAAILMAAGYGMDLVAGPIAPIPMAGAALVAFAASLFAIRRCARAANEGEGVATILTAVVVIVAFVYFLWLASPSLLPVTDGPDVVHHLVLIHLIQRTQHLAHGTALSGYLAEMAGYTPGAHILAALIAAWARVDAVRAIHPIAAAFAAISLGVVYAVAFRSSENGPRAAWQACAAPILALVAAPYTIGAFMHFFFFAQVVSGAFALAMLLAVTAWTRLGTRIALIWCSLCALGIVLAWPVWIVPPALTMIGVAGFRGDRRAILPLIAVALSPAAAFLALHTARHPHAGEILTASGGVTAPSVAVFGVTFTACAVLGAGVAAATRRGVAILVFACAVVLEAFGLFGVSRAAGSGSVYLPFKMMFLLVPPAAILGSLALARLAEAGVAQWPRVRWTAAVMPVLLAAMFVRGRVPARPEHGSITEPALAAGEWAREHLPSACMDYFSSYWLTGYWLHLDVLGNPRTSERARTETFEFRDSVGKWIEGRGLPYGFVEDLDLMPRDARVDMTAIQRFGRAAIVRNLRPAPCVETPPSLWTVAATLER